MQSDNLQHQQAPMLDIGDLIAIAWAKKFRILLTAALIIVAGGYYIKSLPKIYTAYATLSVGGSEQSNSLPFNLASLAASGDAKMGTHIEFLKSRQFAEKLIVDNLLLKAFKQYESREETLYHAIDTFRRGLGLAKLGDTNMLQVSYMSPDPELAARIANAVGPTFFIIQKTRKREKANNATNWLNGQLDSVQTKLSEAEESLQSYLRTHTLIDVGSQIELARTEISTLLSEKLHNDKALAGVSATVDTVQKYKGNTSKLLSIPWLMKQNIIQDMRVRINVAEQHLNEVSKRYKHKHPKHIAATSAYTSLVQEQEELVVKLLEGLRQEFETLRSRSQELQAQIDAAKARHSELGNHEINLARLRRQAESMQRLYDSFLSHLNDTQLMRDFGDNDDYVIIDYASVPKRPSHPKVVALFAALVLASLLFSIAGWVFLHLVSDKYNRYRKLFDKLNVPILVDVPKLSSNWGKKSVEDRIMRERQSFVFSEAIRTLRTSVMVRSENEENRIIAVTALSKGDSDAYLSAHLAESFARIESTLLMDANLREPAIANLYGMPIDTAGIINLLTKSAKASECMRRIPTMKLAVMPSGPLPSDPTVYLSKPRFKGLLQRLGVLFERLVIELPPLSTVSDALVVSRYVDGVIIVCDVEKSDTKDVINGIQRLKDINAPILGVVIHRAKKTKEEFVDESLTRRLLNRVLKI
ncbi:polysaccharide biosynthesis tyrosine autokinase [Aestuariibacter sp. AA17]|uniref:Polysaccharide biosynthesis tyrosine autokinase n=1 Tax=Fluctibacter corallii TaxID=2984329 RepID=A0ABT3ADE6_9ALTE|nr:polysaccharide biosynthesis tyrosine autokinase [Aestuariibacter sp. AA17]MCV2886679.1 polysaccharide biosynthesis tyrosine autokinase [Aestuariibacter sp. AA17]